MEQTIEMLPLPEPPKVEAEDMPGDGLRVLTEAEVQTLEPIFAEAGAALPNPVNSFFMGLVENGEVKAFLVAQGVLHAEPLWVKHGYENAMMRVIHATEAEILRRVGPVLVYTFAPAGNVTRIAQLSGMKLEPWNVLSKFLVPEEESIPLAEVAPVAPVVEDPPVESPPVEEAVQ